MRYIFAAGSVTNTTGNTMPLRFYRTSTSKHPMRDLVTVDGSGYESGPIPNGVILADTSGAYVSFAGPDDMSELWVEAGVGGTKTQITSTTTVTEAGGASSATQLSTYARARDRDPRNFGTVDTTGGSDSSTAFLAALADAQSVGAGLALPPGRIRLDSQITFTDTGGSNPTQKPTRIYGVGRYINADSAPADLGTAATILDLRYTGGGSNLAKIASKGIGYLEMDHLTLTDMGTSSNPFVKVSRTSPDFHDLSVYGNPTKSGATCDQDGFVFGGTIGWTGHGYGGTIDSAYEGYGGIALQNVFFDRIRTCGLFQASANSLTVRGCTVWQYCGGGSTDAAFVIDPGTDTGTAEANLFDGNLIEMVNYYYGFKVLRSTRNVFQNNNFWDDGAQVVAHHWFSTGSSKNLVMGGGQGSVSPTLHFKDDIGTNVLIGMTGDRPYVRSPQGLALDNNAGLSMRTAVNTPGTPQPVITLTTSDGVTFGDVNEAFGNTSHIFKGASNGVLRMRLSSTDMVVVSSGEVKIGDAAYNGTRLRMGAYYLWVDGSGRLRIKSGAPTTDTDGTIVGVQA